MAPSPPRHFLHESALTRAAVTASVLAILATATFLIWQYPSLPALLPVHFTWDGRPNGWQYRTLPRVLLPVFIQAGIFLTCAAIGSLLLYRKDAATARAQPDAQAAVTATEAVMSMGAIWVVFQAYAAYALTSLWAGGAATLGAGYSVSELAGLLITVVVAVRAQRQLAAPEPLPYVPSHWRLGQLYCNANHPALFVPTRNGRRWTLNFGRRNAVVLLGAVLGIGIVGPTAMLILALR